MSASGVDQDYVDALKATCGLMGCAAKPGEPCINSVTGEGPRGVPHDNRVARGRAPATAEFKRGGYVPTAAGELALSTSEKLRRAERELAEDRHEWALDVAALIQARQEIERQAIQIDHLTRKPTAPATVAGRTDKGEPHQ